MQQVETRVAAVAVAAAAGAVAVAVAAPGAAAVGWVLLQQPALLLRRPRSWRLQQPSAEKQPHPGLLLLHALLLLLELQELPFHPVLLLLLLL